MKIIKRSGAENTFDKEKIENAVAKANITVEEKDRLSEGEIGEIAQNIEDKCSEMNRAMDVETIRTGWKPISCATASIQWQSIISPTAMSVLSSDRLILLTSRYFLFLTSRTRK